MTEASPPTALLLAGFLATAGSFGAGLTLIYRHAPAQALLAGPEPAPPPEVMEVYYPFPEQLYIAMPSGSLAIVSVSFFLSAPPAQLLALQDRAKTLQASLMADLLAEAQLAAETAPDTASFRQALPGRLQARVNARLASPELQEPVQDVLLTGFVLQG